MGMFPWWKMSYYNKTKYYKHMRKRLLCVCVVGGGEAGTGDALTVDPSR